MPVVDLVIEDVAFGGKGVARNQGKAVFVPFTIDGERVTAEIHREKRQFAEAELIKVEKESSHRVEPKCPYFGRCGGCSYQHIDYEHQLALKSRQVRDVIQRIGKIKDASMQSIVASPMPYGYRNRITLHAKDDVIGFFRRDSRHLIDIERCPIATDQVNDGLARLRSGVVRDGHYTLRAEAVPQVFSQTNDIVADSMREFIKSLIPSDRDLLLDAYCGGGFFAKALLDKFKRVIGIDWDRFAITVARQNATAKETYIAGDIEEQLGRANMTALSSHVSNPMDATRNTTLIVDPPATGLSSTVRKSIVDLSPITLIYVSCNPATLARDLGDLRRAFRILSITPFDMFPQTAEIEVVAHLQRANDSTIYQTV